MQSRSYVTEDGGRLNTYAVEPKMYVDPEGEPGLFTPNAEKVNGRFAMLGFIALILTEVATGQSLLDLLGNL